MQERKEARSGGKVKCETENIKKLRQRIKRKELNNLLYASASLVMEILEATWRAYEIETEQPIRIRRQDLIVD